MDSKSKGARIARKHCAVAPGRVAFTVTNRTALAADIDAAIEEAVARQKRADDAYIAERVAQSTNAAEVVSQLAAEAQACVRLMVDEMGIGPWMHEQQEDGEECPADDTCTCPKVQRINAACGAVMDEPKQDEHPLLRLCVCHYPPHVYLPGKCSPGHRVSPDEPGEQ